MKKRWHLPFLVLLIIGTIIILKRNHDNPYHTNRGLVFGTLYTITYQYADDLKGKIEQALKRVDNSLSPFNQQSIITGINENRPGVMPDSLFLDVFELAEQVYADTEGAFDITVAPLVNAWGFGFKQGLRVDSLTIDSLRRFVGMELVGYDGHTIVKKDERVMLDCSAIAKGYGCDVVATLFDSLGIKNYMIEIGGEIVVKGESAKRKRWTIGVNKPVDDTLALKSELQTVLRLTDCAMATSGNYRNYYYRDGKKYAHTIDPKSGYPVQHSLLSATVVAPNCAMADAYATSFMVMGVEKAMELCDRNPALKGYFIYVDSTGNYATCYSKDMEPLFVK
ncbi:MAG: FAD:protein FMN transferase [Bacteroidaceae bacterium]|nr:FAD:protein FMN transferase [Bacteroidaceae bacterium]